MCSLIAVEDAPWFVGTMEREKAESFLMEASETVK